MNPNDEADRNLRLTILGTLRMIASDVIQLEYERDVPGVDVGSELHAGWFALYEPIFGNLPSSFEHKSGGSPRCRT